MAERAPQGPGRARYPQSGAPTQNRIDTTLPTITKETFDALHREIVDLFTANEDSTRPVPQEAGRPPRGGLHRNLRLLSCDDNSVLNNSVFEVKRRHVIDLDQSGSYIPVCTRNVFLKYYDNEASSPAGPLLGTKQIRRYTLEAHADCSIRTPPRGHPGKRAVGRHRGRCRMSESASPGLSAPPTRPCSRRRRGRTPTVAQVEIPLIQRDYAQGREDLRTSAIRDRIP